MTPSFPGLPERIKELGELASDLWWSWHYRARDLFRRLDYTLWRSSAHNPVAMLRQIAPERLEAVSRDRAFLALYDDAVRDHRAARASRDSWWSRTHGETRQAPRLRTSRPNSRCISRCPSTRAASASWPAISAKRRATWACRSSASGSCTRRGTSTRRSRPTAGRRRPTRSSTGTTRRRGRPSIPTGRAASCRCRSARGPCMRRSGRSGPARCGCSCSTPTWNRTRRGTAGCRRACTGATRTCASSRRSSSASAASGRSRRWASSPPSGT